MLEKLIKLYTMAMAYDVRSPMPHLFGPPGSNKSGVAEQLAKLLGVNLHIINVSRISPLEIEGVEMPHGEGDSMVLKLLHSIRWTSLQEGDIIFFDEFLRGFPEVYNALLDIVTSRQVAGLHLPKVFIMGASNSVVAYDKALEDRLLHITVPDLRKNKTAKAEAASVLVEALGLMPQIVNAYEMKTVIDDVVAPMYDILDSIGKAKGGAPASLKGRSLRNLIGQVQLRECNEPAMSELIAFNNRTAMGAGKPQFVLLLDGKPATLAALPGRYEQDALTMVNDEVIFNKLNQQQQLNLQLNLQLIELETVRTKKKGTTADDNSDVFLEDLEL